MNAHVSEDGGANDHSGPIIEIRLREDFLSHDAQCEADMASRIFDKTIRRFEMADVSHLIAVFVYAQDSEGRDPEITIATLDEIRVLSRARPTGMYYLGYAAMFDADARVSIGIQLGPLIGVQKGPLRRDASWPEAA